LFILSVAKDLACSPGRVRRAIAQDAEKKRSQAKLFCLLSLPDLCVADAVPERPSRFFATAAFAQK